MCHYVVQVIKPTWQQQAGGLLYQSQKQRARAAKAVYWFFCDKAEVKRELNTNNTKETAEKLNEHPLLQRLFIAFCDDLRSAECLLLCLAQQISRLLFSP